MNTQHTPAPWDRKLICTGEYSSAWRVSHTFKPAIHPRIICDVPSNLGDTQGNANGKLIAAAPELLEALRDCLALIVNGPDGCDDNPKRIEDQARAVIAKATGGTL